MYATVTLPLVLAGAGIGAVYGAAKRSCHTFEYNGQPYIRVDVQTSHTETYKVINKDPSGGHYKAIYESSRLRTGKASVTIYGEKRNLPDNKVKITQLKASIETLQDDIQSLDTEKQNILLANQNLQSAISELLTEGKINVERQKLHLDGLIRKANERIALLQTEKEEKTANLSEIKSILSKKKSFFDMIIKLATFMDFNSIHYPDIMQIFKTLIKSVMEPTGVTEVGLFRPTGNVGPTPTVTARPLGYETSVRLPPPL